MGSGSAKLGFIGIFAGAIALMLALVSFWAGPFSEQPTLEESVAETALSIRDATVAALRGEEYEPPTAAEPQFDIDEAIALTIPG